MSAFRRWRGAWFRFVTAGCTAVAIAATAAAASGPAAYPIGHHPRAGPALELSRGCGRGNAEAEQAVDYPYVYETWIGCGGIGFARSVNGGRSFSRPIRVPGSAGHGLWRIGSVYVNTSGWDPAVAVAPDGAVYVSYMIARRPYLHPVVAVSADHGASFTRVSEVMPPARPKVNWGDRDFIAVAPDGTVDLTWAYGLSARRGFLGKGHANAVIQTSSDGGKTWSRITPVSPGYPNRGEVSAAPLIVEPGGRIDVLMWDGHHDYLTSSADGGETWSRPVAIPPRAGRTGTRVTWIDTAIGIDAAGRLYAIWDTQGTGGDIGWLSYSADHGRTWSPARRVTPDHDRAGHIMAVTGGPPGIAYVGWLAGGPQFSPSARPYVLYMRKFSVRRGWLSAPIRVSRRPGNRKGWPGDTIGISLLPGHRVRLSWGIPSGESTGQIWTAQVSHL